MKHKQTVDLDLNQQKYSFQLRARRQICFMQIILLYSIQSSQSNSSQIFYLMCNVMLFLLMFNLPSLLDQLPIFEFSMIGSCKDHSSQNLKTKTQSKIFEKRNKKFQTTRKDIAQFFLSSSNMYQGSRFTKHLMYAQCSLKELNWTT